jgi:LTXXQ motif family protein
MRRFANSITNWKAATVLASASLLLCGVTGGALAAKPGPGRPPSGGPPPPAHMAVPHITPHVAPQHFTPHVSSFHLHITPHFHAAHNNAVTTHHNFASGPHGRHAVSSSVKTDARSRFAHVHNGHGPKTPSNLKATNNLKAKNNLKTTNSALTNARVRPLANAADPRRFEERRRNFAQNAAFRPFVGHDWWRHGWHPYRHLGWIGPLFWPYAYGDFFYYALWPDDYEYVDPFWAYGYGDIYEAIFSPYSYDEYVAGPQAPERMATLAQGMAQSCDQEAAEVTGWPIDQIQSAVQPNPQQTALLDDLGNAIVEASHQIKIHCPTSVAFTPTTRLDQMHQRLQTLVDAVNIISPPLTKFYDSLSDEQKARFNDIAPPAPKNAQNTQGQPSGQENEPSVQAQCNANVMAWPTDQIDNTVHPNDAQRAKLDALKSALSQGADTIKVACPTEVPPTPPDRLAAIGNRLKAMLQAVVTVQPALADFYNSLSDDQKARFNTMGKQLFAQNQE